MSTIRWLPTTAQALNKSSGTMVIGSPGSGKALWEDEFVVTPHGPMRVKDVRVGDYLIGKNGKPTKVLAVHPQPCPKRMYILETEDKRSIVGCEEHLFRVYTDRNSNSAITLTMGEMASNPNTSYYIDNNDEIEYYGTNPYNMTYLYGVIAGICESYAWEAEYRIQLPKYVGIKVAEHIASLLSCHLGEIVVIEDMGERYGFKTTNGLGEAYYVRYHSLGKNCDLYKIFQLGRRYLSHISNHNIEWNSLGRQHFIQGLFDIGATVIDKNTVCYYTDDTTPFVQGEDNFAQIILGLGNLVIDEPRYDKKRDRFKVLVHGSPKALLRLFLHSESAIAALEKHKEEGDNKEYTRLRVANIVGTALVANCTCFTVDAEDSQFIAGRLVVTHNTFFMLNTAANCLGLGQRIIAVDPKNDFAKLLNISSQVEFIDVNHIRPGALNPFTFLDKLDATTLLTIIEIICGKLDKSDIIQVTPIAQDFIVMAERDGVYVDMQDVADYLYSRDNESAQTVGTMLKVHEKSKYGALLFTREDNVAPLRLSKSSSMVISLHGMPLPNYTKKVEDYSPSERLTSAIMYIITSKLLEILSTPNQIPVTLFCDEAHILFGNKEMSAVIQKFLTMGRSLNVASVLGSQGIGHFPKDIAQYISTKFMFKSSVEEAKKFLDMFNTSQGTSNGQLDMDAIVQSVADFKTSGNCFMMDCLNRSGLVHITSNYDIDLLTSNPFKKSYAEQDALETSEEVDSIISVSGGVFRE